MLASTVTLKTITENNINTKKKHVDHEMVSVVADGTLQNSKYKKL